MPPRARRLLALAAGVALLVVPLILLVPWGTATHYSAYDAGGEHLARFRESLEEAGFETRAIVSSPLLLADVADARGHLYVAAGVERAYTTAEVDALVAFVERGGRLLVLDDFQGANALAVPFGVGFGRHRLLDEQNENSTTLVLASGTVAGREFPHLLLGEPGHLLVPSTASAVVLVNSSDKSYADVDGDRKVTVSDTHGPFPLAIAVERSALTGNAADGETVAVFVSDADFLTNAFLTREAGLRGEGSNLAFAEALVDLLVADPRVAYLDESRHANGLAEPSYRALALAAGATRGTVGLVLLAVAAVGSAGLLGWTAFTEKERRHEQNLGVRRPLDVPVARQHAVLRALVAAKLAQQANEEDGAAFARANPAEAERLLKDARLAAFVANAQLAPAGDEWTRILDAARRYLE